MMNKSNNPMTYESPKVEEMTLEVEGAILSDSPGANNERFEDGGSTIF